MNDITKEKITRLASEIANTPQNWGPCSIEDKIYEIFIEAFAWKQTEFNRKERDLEERIEKSKQVLKEQAERNRSKLLSIYYLLGTIKDMGTHVEKRIAVNYLMQTVDTLVNKPDNLSWDQDLLPF